MEACMKIKNKEEIRDLQHPLLFLTAILFYRLNTQWSFWLSSCNFYSSFCHCIVNLFLLFWCCVSIDIMLNNKICVKTITVDSLIKLWHSEQRGDSGVHSYFISSHLFSRWWFLPKSERQIHHQIHHQLHHPCGWWIWPWFWWFLNVLRVC